MYKYLFYYRLVIVNLASIAVLTSCSQAPSSSAPAATPTSTTSATSTNSNATNSTNSSQVIATGVSILSFSPPAGNQSSFPTQIRVYFNKANLNTTNAQNVSNWPINCTSRSTPIYPTSASFSSSEASVTLIYPSQTQSGLNFGDVCTLSPQSSITDTSGNSLSTSSAAYRIGGGVLPYTVNFSSLNPNDRVFGRVNVAVKVAKLVTTAANLTNFYYTLSGSNIGNGVAIGDTTSGSNNSIPFDTTGFRNGNYVIHVLAVDENGIQYPNIATPLAISIQNNNYTSNLSSVGGTGGAANTATAPTGSVLVGFHITYGDYVNSIQPIWRAAFGTNLTLSKGQVYGGSQNANSIDLLCPNAITANSPNYAVTGFKGRSGWYLDQITLICRQEFDFSNQTYVPATGGYGGNGGSAFADLECPANTFITSLLIRAGTYVDAIQGQCN